MDGTAALPFLCNVFYLPFSFKLFANVSRSYWSPKTHKPAASPAPGARFSKRGELLRRHEEEQVVEEYQKMSAITVRNMFADWHYYQLVPCVYYTCIMTTRVNSECSSNVVFTQPFKVTDTLPEAQLHHLKKLLVVISFIILTHVLSYFSPVSNAAAYQC